MNHFRQPDSLLRVLLFSSSSGSQGGGELYLEYLVRALKPFNVEFEIALSNQRHMDVLAQRLEPWAAVHRIPIKHTLHRPSRVVGALLDRKQAKLIKAFVQERSPDVVHLNKQNLEDGLDLLDGAEQSGVPLTTTIHLTRLLGTVGAVGGQMRDYLSLRRLNQSASHFLTVSHACGKELREQLASSAVVSTIQNGVDDHRPTYSREQWRQAWDLPSDAFVMGVVARIDFQKNPLFIARLVAELPPKVHCVWVGDGNMRNEFETEIARRHIEGRVKILGWQQDARQYLSGFDTMILPSVYEGLPLAILESMAAGIPCVASKVDGNAEAIVDGETGYTVPFGDFENWKHVVKQLLDQPEHCTNLGRNARLRFEQHFDVKLMAQNMFEHYQQVAKLLVPK